MKRAQLDTFIAAWRDLMTDYEPGYSPLTLAVKEGYVEGVIALVELGADIDEEDRNDNCPLSIALTPMNVEMIEVLAERGADVDAPLDKGSTPMFTAAARGDLSAIRALAKHGGDANATDDYGNTPLIAATRKCHVGAIRALAEHGGDVNAGNDSGDTPILISARKGHVGAIRALIENEAKLNDWNSAGRNPLYEAARGGHMEAIGVLVEHGGDVNSADEYGRTPLHKAAEDGHVVAIRALVEHGVDVNLRTCDGMTPLCTAAMFGEVDAIATLAKLGGSVNDRDNDERSPPLVFAAECGNEGAVRLLVDLRADIGMSGGLTDCSLVMAMICGNIDICNFLVSIGANVRGLDREITDDPDETYMRTIVYNIEELVAQLWGRVNLVNSSGELDEEDGIKYDIFSLTKLISSAPFDARDVTLLDATAKKDKLLMETTIARCMRQLLSNVVLERMHGMYYVLQRRLVRIAWRVYESSLLLDGDRVSELVKARRYVEVVCFLFDLDVLREVAALRMTCQSNHERRRFPVCITNYHELEENLIEEWLGYGSSRFVPTDVIHAVMAIHTSELQSKLTNNVNE